jgi:hypothetical protein
MSTRNVDSTESKKRAALEQPSEIRPGKRPMTNQNPNLQEIPGVEFISHLPSHKLFY